MIQVRTCVSCVHHRKKKIKEDGDQWSEHYCTHPCFVDIVTGKGPFCESMRKKKGWFSSEGPCGPVGKFHEYNPKEGK